MTAELAQSKENEESLQKSYEYIEQNFKQLKIKSEEKELENQSLLESNAKLQAVREHNQTEEMTRLQQDLQEEQNKLKSLK